MKNNNFKHSEITSKIIKTYYNVYNELAYGFLEKIYENAMMIELVNSRLDCKRQFPIDVWYQNKKIGDYFADIMVENKVIIELKAVENLIKNTKFN